jgi:hypothetical protein
MRRTCMGRGGTDKDHREQGENKPLLFAHFYLRLMSPFDSVNVVAKHSLVRDRSFASFMRDVVPSESGGKSDPMFSKPTLSISSRGLHAQLAPLKISRIRAASPFFWERTRS